MNTVTTKPDLLIRRSHERGHARHGWLDSHHTFSFAGYYDPAHMGFGDLRVINEDRVAPGQGFGTHGHRDMEIISYVVSGALAHRDSTGSGGVIRPGEIQVMSAGRGIRHSEMNGSTTEPVHFLQIWLMPAATGTTPRYEDRAFPPALGATLLVSPDGREGSLPIGQDAELYRVLLADDASHELLLSRSRAWVQVVRGQITLFGEALATGDGAGLTATGDRPGTLELYASQAAEVLVFDLN